jgi:hypothetical protein
MDVLCCVNLAGLQIARIQAREQEFAIRSAIGAGCGAYLQLNLNPDALACPD